MSARLKAKAVKVSSELGLLKLSPAKVAQVMRTYSAGRRNEIGTSLCNLVSTLRARVSQENSGVVEFILKNILNPEKRLLDEAIGLALRIECASYFDLLGDHDRAIAIGKDALAAARAISNKNLERRAHNIFVSVYLKDCRFSECFSHLDQSFKLVQEIADPILEMAALANAAALLGDMGLVSDAIRLADRISNIPTSKNQGLYCFVQVQNACNVLRLCRKSRDERALERYYEIACENIGPASDTVDDVCRAHFEWIRAICLVERGEIVAAAEFVELAMADASYKKNDAILALLTMAKAECLIASHVEEDVDRAINSLQEILPRIRSRSSFYEDVLRTLIPALFRSKRAECRETGMHYCQVLRAHLVNVKHRAFYFSVRSRIKLDRGADVMSDPSYRVPSWMDAARNIGVMDVEADCLDGGSQDGVTSIDFTDAFFGDSDVLRKSDYFISAENWAIAAEFSEGRDGLHCFRVARISREIGRALGLTWESCAELEFAVRLHDIGKIVVDEDVLRLTKFGAVDSYRSIIEHALSGEHLLSNIPDPLMKLAAKIARQHHEWWNGSGLPDGLRGEEICIEARICAVADRYLDLVDPARGLPVWPSHLAKQQLVTMAGFQLDPALVNVLVDVIPDSILARCFGPATDELLSQNVMVQAKAQLFNTLDLLP